MGDRSKLLVKLPLLFSIAIATGILIGASMVGDNNKSADIFKSVYKFREIISHIDRDYVDEVDTESLVESAINQMLEELDPHTVYIPSEELSLAKSQLEGNFDGIGIEFNIFKDTIYVVSPLSGGPSEAVGLLPGDKIIKVDGELVAGVNITNKDVYHKLRGPKGTKVTVEIQRNLPDNLLEFNIIRDNIPQFSVDAHYMVDDEIGYIKISRFSATTYEEFKKALMNLKKQGLEKLILDLTGNPGGYMEMAVNVADEFLPGDPMIVYTKGKESRYNAEHRAYRKGLFEKKPLIVLTNAGSASASEIVAGAIQDNDRGLIVGRRTFGKGLVQMPISLKDGSELRLTISRYYTPSGRSIQKPYTDPDSYNNDMEERVLNGEMFYKDSIKINDSLIYKTSKGRIVYGGGGIIPDHFVPLDNKYDNTYLNRLYGTNTIREFTLKYFKENEARLRKYSFEEFTQRFDIDMDMHQGLIELAEENNLPFNPESFQYSIQLINTHMKAHLAKNLWGTSEFYQILNEENDIYISALRLFDQAEQLAKK